MILYVVFMIYHVSLWDNGLHPHNPPLKPKYEGPPLQ